MMAFSLFQFNLFFLFLFPLMPLSFVTLNTGGCSTPLKNASIFSYVGNLLSSPDVIFLQETNNLCKKSSCWNLWSSHTPLCAPGRTRGSGVVTLVKNSTKNVVVHSEITFESHILYTKVELNNATYHLYNVIIPQDDKIALDSIQCLSASLRKLNEGTIIIGGDFNTTPNPSMDRLCKSFEHRPRIANSLQTVVESNRLRDVWRRLHPHDKKFSWQRNNPRSNTGISKARLDRFYAPIDVMSSVLSCDIVPCSLSDHSAVCLKITTPSPQKRGSAFWHFNNSLLEDQNFADIITHFWSEWRNEKPNFPNVSTWWDFGKSHLRSLSQMYGSKLACEKRESIIKINQTIDDLQSTSDLSSDTKKILNEQRNELNLLLKSQAKGALVRSRFQLTNEIDTSSAFFFNLEKSNSSSKSMSRVRLSSGNITEKPSDIKAHVHDFYENLYKRVPTDENCFKTISSNLPRLSHEESMNLDSPFTLEEVKNAVMQLGRNKSPGLDGLSSEFYQFFWPTLKNDLLSVLNHAIISGDLPHSFRKAVITLIPKKGDLADIANWRPVSLLNNDYKILAKVLANRLKLYIGNIVHEDQSYCVPGRQIYDNLHLIRDVINCANCNNTPLAILNLDQKKAFDNVDHNYLFGIMKAMGIGDFFISCVKLLYNNAEGLVKVCGSLTSPFPFQKGIRQGCPLSGLLYSIAIEPFLHMLRQRLDKHSFLIPETNNYISVSAYADDISIFVSTDEAFNIINDVYSTFSKASSASLNYVKSQGLWVGSWTRRSDKPLGFQWNNEGLNFLGVSLGVSRNYMSKNWEKCKEKLSKTLSRWTPLSQSLSFKGKILVANQLAASKVFHCLAVLSPPQNILKELQNMLVNFIWSNKRHLLRKEILFQETDKGGLGLACLQARFFTFRFCFALRFLELFPHPAYQLCAYNLQKYQGLKFDLHLFLIDLETKFFCTLPCFYSDLLHAWRTSGARVETSSFTLNHVLNVPLNYFTSASPRMVFPRLFVCGIRLIKDIINLQEGTWLEASDIKIPSLLHRISRRIIELELMSARQLIIDNFPVFFTRNGPRHSSLILQTLATRITSPFSIKLKDKKDPLILTTRCIYRLLSRTLNNLPNFQLTPWHGMGVLSPSSRITWSAIYKLPSTKKDGDIQYKLMHNVLPSLPVLHHFNPDFSPNCGWCGERGTLLHLLFLCQSIQPALTLLHRLLSYLLPGVKVDFELYWCLVPHARNRNKDAVCLSNFLIISLKSTLYWLYRTSRFIDPLIWKHRVKNKIILEYEFFHLQSNERAFSKRWGLLNMVDLD